VVRAHLVWQTHTNVSEKHAAYVFSEGVKMEAVHSSSAATRLWCHNADDHNFRVSGALQELCSTEIVPDTLQVSCKLNGGIILLCSVVQSKDLK
jgi:hypothetical protein